MPTLVSSEVSVILFAEQKIVNLQNGIIYFVISDRLTYLRNDTNLVSVRMHEQIPVFRSGQRQSGLLALAQ